MINILPNFWELDKGGFYFPKILQLLQKLVTNKILSHTYFKICYDLY